jgi:hypothetical protein
MKVCPDCNTWLAELPCADCTDAEARAAEKARGDEIIVMLGRLLAVSSTAVMAKRGSRFRRCCGISIHPGCTMARS